MIRICSSWTLKQISLVLLALLVAVMLGLPSADLLSATTPAEEGPVIRMRLHAVLVSDDDGGRAVRITPAEIAKWVDYANRLYAFVGIQLDFDPSESSADISTVRSTRLNNIVSSDRSAPDWPAIRAEANAIAAQHRGAVTVFFRYGPGPRPTGQGFAWTDQNFIVMPGFNDTRVCGKQKIEALAHELGHYLGLAHTHPREFASIAEAEDFFEEHGRDPLAFDGDGIEDTLPDPFVLTYQCPSVPSLRLLDVTFILPRNNLMSYYGDQLKNMIITPIQGDITRQCFFIRAGQPLDQIVGGEGPPVLEAEDLPFMRTSGDVVKQDMRVFLGLWSGGTQLFWGARSQGASLTLRFQAESGRYEVFLRPTRGPDFGIHQHSLDGTPAGSPVDLYSRIVRLGQLVSLGIFELNAGTHTLSVKVVGANPRTEAGRFTYGLDYILLKRMRRW